MDTFGLAEGGIAAVDFVGERWGGILRGALVSVYQQAERGSDAAAWLGGERDDEGKRQAGIAGVTVAALREVGLLDEIIPTKEGLIISRLLKA